MRSRTDLNRCASFCSASLPLDQFVGTVGVEPTFATPITNIDLIRISRYAPLLLLMLFDTETSGCKHLLNSYAPPAPPAGVEPALQRLTGVRTTLILERNFSYAPQVGYDPTSDSLTDCCSPLSF